MDDIRLARRKGRIDTVLITVSFHCYHLIVKW